MPTSPCTGGLLLRRKAAGGRLDRDGDQARGGDVGPADAGAARGGAHLMTRLLNLALLAGVWLAMPEALSASRPLPDGTETLRSRLLVAPLTPYLRAVARSCLLRWTRPVPIDFQVERLRLRDDAVMADVAHLVDIGDRTAEESGAWLVAFSVSAMSGGLRLALRGRTGGAESLAWAESWSKHGSSSSNCDDDDDASQSLLGSSWGRRWLMTWVTYAHVADAAVSWAGLVVCMTAGAALLSRALGMPWILRVALWSLRQTVVLSAGLVAAWRTLDAPLPVNLAVTLIVSRCVDGICRHWL